MGLCGGRAAAASTGGLRVKTLVLGGVRSGKSRIAARLVTETGSPVVVFATAQRSDEHMRARIEAHRRCRPAHWRVVEEPRHLASALRREAGGAVLLVDCLTLWLTNLLCGADPALFDMERAALLSFVDDCTNDLVLVSNETNMGVHPMGELSRRFCDEAGSLHQDLAQRCDTVILAVAGLPHVLKSPDAATRT